MAAATPGGCDYRREMQLMDLHYHYTPSSGYTQLVSRGTQPVEYLDFGILTLEAGQTYQETSAHDEIGLVILSGTCAVQVNNQTFEQLGSRASVFDGRATGVYIPRETSFEVRAASPRVEVAICRSQATASYPVQVVRPEDIVVHDVGGAGFTRYVHDILGMQMQASTMIIGETFTVEGNWSSFPPHKHDIEALPDEVQQEEIYLYKIRPAEGFGIQYIYSRPESPHGALEQPMAVRENDITIMPFGYHPVAAPPGYDVYYLWFLGGPKRLMRPHDDPAYAWIKTPRQETRSYPK